MQTKGAFTSHLQWRTKILVPEFTISMSYVSKCLKGWMTFFYHFSATFLSWSVDFSDVQKFYTFSRGFHSLNLFTHFANTGQFKKKVTISHAYNEITGKPTITRYATIVRKALKVLICYLTNTQCGNPVSHDTRQSDSPFLSRLSPACPCLWLPQRRWSAVSVLEDHLGGVVRGWWINSETCAEQPLHSCYRAGLRKLQDTERLLLWSRHFATRSLLAAAPRNTFPRQLQTNFDYFPNNCCISRYCMLTGHFIINMWKCYLLFELPCT
jgi:hypothetical protein